MLVMVLDFVLLILILVFILDADVSRLLLIMSVMSCTPPSVPYCSVLPSPNLTSRDPCCPVLSCPILSCPILSSSPLSSPYYRLPSHCHLRRTAVGADPRTAQHTRASTLFRNALTAQSRLKHSGKYRTCK